MAIGGYLPDDNPVCTKDICHVWSWQGQRWSFDKHCLISISACIWCGDTREEEVHYNV